MKAKETMVLEFLQNSSQFIIPIYQRTYSWELEQCQQLWDDLIRAGESDSASVHFVGSIVYVADGLSTVSLQAPLLVIDGQQRLTTITLLLEALQRALGEEEPVEGFSAEKIKSRYLTRHLEKGDKFFKLILSQTDDLTLRSIIQEREMPEGKSTRVSENFDFFAKEIELLKGKFEILCQGIAKLAIVDIALNRGEDNPQLIFESMNSTGKALSQADLIRNYILMGLKPDLQTRLYESYWRPMELEFGQSAYGEEFDAFMRHYLTIKLSEIPRIDQIYDNFKFHASKEDVAKEGVEALVKNLRVYSQYYCAMSLGKEQDPALNRAFMDLKEFKVDVAYPFLLEVYGDYKSEQLSKSDFIEIIRMVESYAFRRAVVQIPANSMNKTFSRFLLSIDRSKYLESVKAVFASLKSYRRFPNDDEFARALKVRDLYNFRRGAYWLRKLENFNRKELPVLEEYSIEHILPQNEELNSWWQKALGGNWREVQGRLLHTIGNLTLTRYNSEFSDKSFPEKRDLPEGGFKTSPLALNQGLIELDTWNEETINKRADDLAEKALKVWTAPVADPTILKALLVKEKQTIRPVYTYEDHRYLQNEIVLNLFTSLKAQILAIDSSVYEEVLKLYVAFKADTNFVDVVFKSSGLRLTINLPFDDLQDPKHLAENVKGKGRWGNGEVSLEVDSSDDISYAMFIIKQAYERQFDEN
jgi:uncharacterized protein with ParB-like and HNH nuclease domain/predicted transport protein